MYEFLKHGCGQVKVGDDAFLQRTHSHDGSGRTADDLLCFLTDISCLFGSCIDSHNGRLTQNDALAPHIHQCIGGTQIDTDILRKHALVLLLVLFLRRAASPPGTHLLL